MTAESAPTSNIWTGDSGATSHLKNDDQGFFDIEKVHSTVTIGDGDKMKVTLQGKKRYTIIQKNGDTMDVTLNVKFVPGLWCNLISVTTLIANGFQIVNQDKIVILEKDGTKIMFDHVLCNQPGGGFTMGIEMVPRIPADDKAYTSVEPKNLNINRVHDALTHAGHSFIMATCKMMNWSTVGKLSKCEDCVIAKAKKKNLNKMSLHKAEVPGDRICFDLSYILHRSFGGAKYWLLAIDENTSMKWTILLKEKSDVSLAMKNIITMIKMKYKMDVKYVRCDNSGENLAFAEDCKKEQKFAHITMEFTAPNTPTQNGKVERAFATLYGRVRSCNNAAGFNSVYRNGLWAECARHCTMMDNVLCLRGTNK